MNVENVTIVLVLLTAANSAPVIAKCVLGQAAAWPVDFGLVFVDGQPLFGRSKTFRGLVVAVAFAAGAAPMMGLAWRVGAATAAASMTGDLFSSFVKRRLRLAPSSMAPILDQLPEALFGTLAAACVLPLRPAEIAVCVAAFIVGQMVVSRAAYALGLRNEPY
ncbi:CDP-archaeol synthase [Rhodoblastus sp.]|uniref:CDP-archaeol synthase n=1 Tax=Rhodoblastus sp. TaxID=1962975 RepID=UPI0035AF090D